jgi:hypothetical protein
LVQKDKITVFRTANPLSSPPAYISSKLPYGADQLFIKGCHSEEGNLIVFQSAQRQWPTTAILILAIRTSKFGVHYMPVILRERLTVTTVA